MASDLQRWRDMRHSNLRHLVCCLGSTLLLVACAPRDPRDDDDDDDVAVATGEVRVESLRVMTRNMYVGGDVDPIMTAAPDEVPFAVAQAFATMQATDTSGRIAAMADEVRQRRPHLLALQEVSRINIQDPSDLVLGGTTPATTVVHDFLPSLLAALNARGLHYRVVASVQNTDAEAPMITPDFRFVDVRLTDYDVILARDDVPTRLVAQRSYAVSLPLPNGLEVKRGFVAVDAEVQATSFRFVGTHLEDGFLDAQLAQAQELLAFLNDAPGPVIVAGDFNSHAGDGATYQMVTGAGYHDAWRTGWHASTGATCCQAADLQNDRSQLKSRIDFVFSRGLSRFRPEARRTGLRDDERTESGLWASDHAGLVVTYWRTVR